jgi:hypothetical protein
VDVTGYLHVPGPVHAILHFAGSRRRCPRSGP